MPRILIAEPQGFSPTALERLRAVAEVSSQQVARGKLAGVLPDYDAVWIRLAHRIAAADVARPGRCRVIACPVTGLDHLDLEACTKAGIRVVSLKGELEFLRTVRATAELTVGLALAVMRRVPAAAASVAAGEWDRNAFRGDELYGKTAGIIGVGRLGVLVAGYLRAFGMRVIGYDVRPFHETGIDPAPTLHALLAQSDLISLHVSYDHSTKGLIDAHAFAAMKAGAYFINTSRSGIVDESAMLAALREGRLAGAALDVLSTEPDVAKDHPVTVYARQHDNIVVVPHIGGNTHQSFEKTEQFIAQKLIEALGA
jgi:D-3-phosphoglycerate dehydrogenase